MLTSKKLRYQIDLDERQARIMIKALDLYSRIGMGQLKVIQEEFQKNTAFQDRCFNAHALIRAYLDSAKFLMVQQPSNGDLSMSDHRIHDDFKESCEMQQVIRKQIADDTMKPGDVRSTWQDAPLTLTGKPFIKIRKVAP